jgi:hypothetical protein
MDEIYNKVLREFPEIGKSVGSGPVTILQAQDLINVIAEAGRRIPRINFIDTKPI